MPHTTFDLPDLSAFTRLDGPGLEVTGQRIEPDNAVLACHITGEDRWCRRAGHQECAHRWQQHPVAHTQLGRATNRSHK